MYLRLACLVAVVLLGGYGFQLSDDNTIDFPDAARTFASGINEDGDIVGDYRDASGNDHGFLLSDHDGTFTTIDFPGAAHTVAIGINEDEDIVDG